jgi:hypothetical protein
MENKRNRHGREGHNATGNPTESIHLGEGERIRLEDVPILGETGDQQVGNRQYNDGRYQADNEVKVIYINSADLSGSGTVENQIKTYLNSTISVIYSKRNSKLNIVIRPNINIGLPYVLPFTLT